MIISDDFRFAFVHVPKCAGTSVRRSLRALDTTGEAFFRISDHPVLGPVHLAHLTLGQLAAHYPHDFAKLRSYQSFAILRDPTDRFISAVNQRLREFKLVPQSSITLPLIREEASRVIACLERTDELDLEYVHFIPQAKFTDLKGERIVQHLFAVEHMDDAAAFIEGLTGTRIIKEHRNKTTELRFRALRPLQRGLREPYTRLFSDARRAAIRRKMSSFGFYRSPKTKEVIASDDPIASFVRDYYAADIALHKAVVARAESKASAA